MTKENKLKHLHLSHCNLNDNSLSLLSAALSSSHSLLSINLSLMVFGSASLLALARGLGNNVSLIELDISYI